MTEIVKSHSRAEDQLAFRFVSGHCALDFTATFGDRHRDGVERLREPADLDRWLTAAGMSASTRADSDDLDDARELREAIDHLARAALRNEPVDDTDLDALNGWARTPRPAPQLDRRLRRQWASARAINGALALIACEAVELLSGPDRLLIRECAAAPACSLLYLDRSRGRRRRWCEMERCGSRAKMTRYRTRRAGPPTTMATARQAPGGPSSSHATAEDSVVSVCRVAVVVRGGLCHVLMV
jgi:predicted RNA-binding Zn ribbon-like protein